MIGYGFDKILISVLSALFFGGIFSIFCFFLQLITFACRLIINGAHHKMCMEKSCLKARVTKENYMSSLGVFISVLAFGLCFMLLSYVFLDGQIRLYYLASCLVGFVICNKTLVRFIRPVVFISTEKCITCIFKLELKLRTTLSNTINTVKRQKLVAKKKK